MSLKKNWFYHFSISLAVMGLLYIIVCGFASLGERQEYPYLAKGVLLGAVFGVFTLILLFAKLTANITMFQRIKINSKIYVYAEVLFVVAILVAAVFARFAVIAEFPMKPASDYKTYYEIADFLNQGLLQKEGKGYIDYISMFPHVMGYSYLLKMAFSVFGTSVVVGQYLNIFFSVMTAFFVYKIARKLGGRLAGITALILGAFWPSQVLYITMLSAEYSFTFFLFLGIWIFVSLVKDYDGNTKSAVTGIIMHFVLGIVLALAAAIRPMALIFLIAVIITIAPQKMKLPLVHKNTLSLTLRMLEKGWVRCILILFSYVLVSNVITTNIELAINKTLPSASTSFGYNLLVGLNVDSKGGWNEADSQFLYSNIEETGSASKAHVAARDLAFERIKQNPQEMINLFLEKYELLWGNDDYGTTWNLAFLEEQGNLTKERSDFLYGIRDINNILYMVVTFMSLISLIYIWKRKGNFAFALVLLYLGTVAMHLFVESQNRYHYYILQVFMILAGMSVSFLYEDAKAAIQAKKEQIKSDAVEQQMMQQAIESYHTSEKTVEELREEIYANVFDMKAALENGSIVMTVSQAYSEDSLKDIDTANLEVAAVSQNHG